MGRPPVTKLLTLSLIAALGVVGCEGEEGPTGPEGMAGPQGPQGNPGTQGPAGMPAAQGLAGVSATGALLRGVNVASVERLDVGRYRVTFTAAVNVDAGYYLVTPGLTGTCVTRFSAERADGNAVWVGFGSEPLNFVDCAFSLVVF